MENMNVFVERPNLDMYPGIKVTKATKLEFHAEGVDQTIENLVLHSVSKVKGDGYESTYDTTIYLEEGDVLLFEPESRGYIKPVKPFVSIKEALEDYENIKGLDKEQ